MKLIPGRRGRERAREFDDDDENQRTRAPARFKLMINHELRLGSRWEGKMRPTGRTCQSAASANMRRPSALRVRDPATQALHWRDISLGGQAAQHGRHVTAVERNFRWLSSWVLCAQGRCRCLPTTTTGGELDWLRSGFLQFHFSNSKRAPLTLGRAAACACH